MVCYFQHPLSLSANEPDFQLTNLQHVAPSTETEPSHWTYDRDQDQAVSDNYRRMSWKRMADLDKDTPGTTTFAQYRKESLGELQTVMRHLFATPPLELQDFGGLRDSGVFRFSKGTVSDFHYKNLSGGEKAAFDRPTGRICEAVRVSGLRYTASTSRRHMLLRRFTDLS